MATAGKTVAFKDKDYVDNEFIDIASAPDDEYLKGDGTWVTAAEIIGVGLLLDTLGDVTLTSPADDDFLVYDTATSLWKNEASSSIPASIGLGTTAAVEFRDLTLSGNLVVQGTETVLNVQEMGVVDPIITLQTAADGGPLLVDTNKDVGIGFQYFDGASKTAFLGFDDSEAKLAFVPNATITADVVTGSKGTIVADLEGSITAQGDTELYALSQVTSAADKGIQFTGSGTAATYDLTSAGKALLDDADAATQRLTLGLGSVATHSLSSVLAMASGSASATYSPATKKILKAGLGTIATHSLSSVVAMMSSTQSISGMKDIDITNATTNDVIVYDGIRWVNQTPPTARLSLGLGSVATHSLSNILAMASGSASASYDPATKNILKAGLGTIATHSLSSVLGLIGEPRLPNYISPSTERILRQGLGTIATKSFATVLSSFDHNTTLKALQDTLVDSATIADNDFLVYNIGDAKWYNRSAAISRTKMGVAIGTDVFAQPSATGSLPLPVGTTAQQAGSQGGIRYNTTISSFEGYNGSTWGALADPNVSSITRTTYTATGGETAVNVAYTVGQLSVYLNGVKLLEGVGNDFVASNGTSITGLTALSASDHIDFVDYGIFNAADTVSAASGGTFFGDIFAPNLGTIAKHSLSSVLAMASGSASATYSPATKNILKAGLGTIATHSLSSVLAMASGSASASYDPATKKILKAGLGTIATHSLSSVLSMARGASPTEREVIQLIGENETPSPWTTTGNDIYYNTGLLGIGIAIPTNPLHVEGDQNYLAYIKQTGSNIHLMALRGPSSAGLDFHLDGANDKVRINSIDANDSLCFETADGSERMRIESDGEVGIGITDPDSRLEVKDKIKVSSDTTNPLFDLDNQTTNGKNWRMQGESGDGAFTFKNATDNITAYQITTTGDVSFDGTVTASGGNSSNWTTAYGWGNHASAGYTTTSSPWTTSGSDIYFNSGNVGIGLTSGFSEKLHVNGNIYCNDLNTADIKMSNERPNHPGNEIDGTHGTWTFQEGDQNMFLINRKSGKRYKLMLDEVE